MAKGARRPSAGPVAIGERPAARVGHDDSGSTQKANLHSPKPLMGNMVEISILTDGFGQVEKYPKEFVQTINRAMQSHTDDRVSYGIGNHANCLTIHPFHHADTPKVYLADRNLFVALDEFGVEDYVRSTRALDSNLDFVEQEILKAQIMLQSAKVYVNYLREKVGYDERPGQPDCPPGAHHGLSRS